MDTSPHEAWKALLSAEPVRAAAQKIITSTPYFDVLSETSC